MEEEIKKEAIFRMKESRERILNCLTKLDENEIWHSPNSSSNSIGNLVLHLEGNIRQYILSSLGGKTDQRNRDLEFEPGRNIKSSELSERINRVIERSIQTITDQDQESLMKRRIVQGFDLSGIGIIIHVVEHLSYHTGQIAYWTKAMKNTDLGFYAGLDLNKKNKPD